VRWKASFESTWSPESGISAMLRQALDLSKNALDKAKRDLGNSPSNYELQETPKKRI
jgi:hypothetical protein